MAIDYWGRKQKEKIEIKKTKKPNTIKFHIIFCLSSPISCRTKPSLNSHFYIYI